MLKLTCRPRRLLGLDVDHLLLHVGRAPHRSDGARRSRERGLEVHRLRSGEEVVGEPVLSFFFHRKKVSFSVFSREKKSAEKC